MLIIFLLANLLLLPFGYVAARAAQYIFNVPRSYLNAAILLFCIVGSYAINNSLFGVWVMIVTGVLAWFLESRGFAIAPIILGIVLGPLVEQNFTTSMMIARGDLLDFFARPIAAGIGIVTLLIWAAYSVSAWRRAARVSATGPR